MKIKCPKCNAAYDLELECSGRKAECGVCGKKFPVCFELEETINVLIKKYHLQLEDASLVRTIIRYHEVYPFFLMRKTGKSESYIEDALNRMEQNEMLTLPFDEIGHRHILFLNRFQLNYHSILPPDLLLKHLQEDEKHFREHFFRCFCPFCNQEYKTLPKEYNMKDAECGRCGSRFKMTPYPETEPTRYHVSAIAEPKIPPKSVKSDPVEPETVNSKSVIAEPPPLVMGSDTAQPCCHIKSNIANVEPAKPESMERNLLSRWNRSQYLGRLLSLPSRKWVSPILAGLNNEQLEAVKATKGYIRVVAGAGTGKTRVLIQRLAYLIQDLGIPSDRILSVTFTNKAAGEMKNRVRQLLGDNINSRVQTFHGFCNTVLREDIHRLCYPPTFSIMDEEDQKLIIKDTFSELKLTSRDFKFKEIKKIVSKLKNNVAYVEAVTAPMPDSLHDDPEESMEQRIVKSYLRKQRKNFFLDYDDLIMFTLHLFHKVPAVLIKWQERLSYIQVDEFQDVNRSQYDLVNMLALKHKNLFVVGDPDQTIYEWRGANVHFFLDFPADKTILLSRNYRSVMEILKVGNTLIANNKFRINNSLCSVKKRGERPLWYHAMKFGEEGRWIASKIAGLFGQYHYSDCAILCRSLHVTRRIEEALINESIPYHIFNGTDFYSRKEVKDALSFLRLIAVGDDLSFLRVINLPPRGMGKKRIDLLKEIAAERKITLFQALAENLSNKMFHQATGFMEIIQRLQRRNEHEDSISDILNDVLQSTEYEAAVLLEGDDERKKNLEEFKRSVYNLETGVGEKITLQEYLNQISMYSEKNEEKGEDTVKIMTIHTAKGMEFPCVFVAGLNEGTLPNTHALLPEEIEQERRVAYVAFTRAKEKLFLSSDVDTYNWDGVLMKPSRFVDEISNSITICNQ